MQMAVRSCKPPLVPQQASSDAHLLVALAGTAFYYVRHWSAPTASPQRTGNTSVDGVA